MMTAAELTTNRTFPLPSDVRMADKAAFRQAMAYVPAAVHIITTDGPAGRAGVTVTAMCSLTDEPPMLIVCLNRQLRAAAAVIANGRLAINTLPGDGAELSAVFAGQKGLDMEERFNTGAEWGLFDSRTPYLVDALCNIDCRVDNVVEQGTHYVLFCAVRDVRINRPDPGLIYHNRQYSVNATGVDALA